MKILILGTGGVGGYLGAKLHSSGHKVIFAARGEHLRAIREHGLTLESPEGTLHVKAAVLDSSAAPAQFDLIIVSVKSFDTERAAAQCLPFLHESTIVLSIQNGVENETLIGSILGDRHVVGGVAYILSTIEKPGVVRHHGGTTKFKIGEMTGSMTERLTRLEGVFRSAGITCESVAEFPTILWEKFIFITGMAGMTAYTRQPIGKILDETQQRDMLMRVVSESASVGRKTGIDLFVGIEERAEANYRRMPPESTSSMYYDITHGKRLEVEALNGAIVRMGRTFGIDVPVNGEIYRALREYNDKFRSE